MQLSKPQQHGVDRQVSCKKSTRQYVYAGGDVCITTPVLQNAFSLCYSPRSSPNHVARVQANSAGADVHSSLYHFCLHARSVDSYISALRRALEPFHGQSCPLCSLLPCRPSTTKKRSSQKVYTSKQTQLRATTIQYADSFWKVRNSTVNVDLGVGMTTPLGKPLIFLYLLQQGKGAQRQTTSRPWGLPTCVSCETVTSAWWTAPRAKMTRGFKC